MGNGGHQFWAEVISTGKNLIHGGSDCGDSGRLAKVAIGAGRTSDRAHFLIREHGENQAGKFRPHPPDMGQRFNFTTAGESEVENNDISRFTFDEVKNLPRI